MPSILRSRSSEVVETATGARPPLLYKYRDVQKAREVLATRMVWRCSPLLFNDPFDTCYFWRFPFSLSELGDVLAARIEQFIRCDDMLPADMPDMLKEQVRIGRQVRREGGRLSEALLHLRRALAQGMERVAGQLEDYRRAWREDLRTMRVFCLSEPYDDLLMWAHYADYHRGVVIGFREVPQKNTVLCGDARAVTYQADLPALLDTADEWAAHMTGEAPMDMDAAFLRMAFTKSDHWRYEKEWRWWDRAKPGMEGLAEPIRVDAEDFATVYLGCRITPEDRDAIVRIVREQLPDVTLYEARQSDKRFGLDFEMLPRS